MTSVKKAVTAHYMTYWGMPQKINRRVAYSDRINELAILEFPPKQRRHTSRLATNGMSSLVQTSETATYRTELFTCCLSNSEWIVHLLDVLARYPGDQETNLNEFDTIPTNESIDGSSSIFTTLLLAPPGPEDTDALGAILGATPEPIIIHQVVGISESECDFAVDKGGEKLWKLLLQLDQPLLIDQSRPQVA